MKVLRRERWIEPKSGKAFEEWVDGIEKDAFLVREVLPIECPHSLIDANQGIPSAAVSEDGIICVNLSGELTIENAVILRNWLWQAIQYSTSVKHGS